MLITGGLILGGGLQQVVAQRRASADLHATKTASSPTLSTQARRGQKQYASNCAMCHAQDLTGLDPAPALTGERFMRKWQGKSMWELFDKIRKTMPQNDRGSLSLHAYLDIMAYLAKFNNVDLGPQELRDPKPLKGVTIGKQDTKPSGKT